MKIPDHAIAAAAAYESRWRKHIESRPSGSFHQSNRASALGDPCERKLVLWRVAGHLAEEIPPVLKSIFEQGDDIERIVRTKMARDLDFDVIGTAIPFPPNDYEITGHVDGRMPWGTLLGDQRFLILEVKSLNGYDFDRLKTWEDLRSSRKPFIRRWLDQIMLYCFLADLEGAVLVLYNKATGEQRAIPIGIDFERVEWLTDRAERINKAVEKYPKGLPEYIDDPSECRRCPFFGRVCTPPLDFGEGAKVIADSVLEEALSMIEEHRPSHREFTSQWKRVRAWADDVVRLLPDKDEHRFLVGDWQIIMSKRMRNGVTHWTMNTERIGEPEEES